jgi:hypothetical protein
MTPANKAEVQQAEAAELAEGRVRTKQNASGEHTSPTQSGYGVPQRLAGVRRVAVWFGATSCEVGAVCGSSARTDLCGGRSVMIVPTATPFFPGSCRNYTSAPGREWWGTSRPSSRGRPSPRRPSELDDRLISLIRPPTAASRA